MYIIWEFFLKRSALTKKYSKIVDHKLANLLQDSTLIGISSKQGFWHFFKALLLLHFSSWGIYFKGTQNKLDIRQILSNPIYYGSLPLQWNKQKHCLLVCNWMERYHFLTMSKIWKKLIIWILDLQSPSVMTHTGCPLKGPRSTGLSGWMPLTPLRHWKICIGH